MANQKTKKKFEFPSAFAILFILLVVIALATWLVPAGQYDYDENGSPIPGSYHSVPSNPQALLSSALKGPINGMYGIQDETGNVDVWNFGELFGAIDVAMFVLIIGGFLGVTMKTGAINAGIAWVVSKLKGKEKWMFPILMTIFAIGGTSYGMAEETLAFYALIITVMLAAGYDGLSAGALILLGAGIGCLGSTVNPFATGIASGFAGTTLSDGLIGRVVLLIVGTIIGIVFVMRYAEKVKKDPTKSLIYDMKTANEKQFMSGKDEGTDFGKFTTRHIVILVFFFLAFVVMVYGVIPWEDLGLSIPTWWWWFPEMTANFLFFGILIGIIGKLSEKDLVNTFVDGAKDMLGVALIIGVARGVTVIMNNGLITDTVLYWAEKALSGLSSVGFIVVTYLLYIPLSFLIPSSSGLATVSMPIMAPLAGFAGVNPALVVTAFQAASGLVNLVTPTSAVVMGGLAIARVGYGVWWKFVGLVLALLFILTIIVLSAGVLAS
ncbi:MAG: C4-dicarboxylate ABC transporter [Anaerolineales bacterium]|nr:MAG: C4-dicarboxylate ABC transporter [Anaerolineales bacterium]